jgi:SAM-dependent methyltransferase
MTKTWQDFWNGPQRLYVNDQHAVRHYRQIAHGLIDAGRAERGQTWLDFGCGEALGAPLFPEAGVDLFLFDKSDRMRGQVKRRFGGVAGLRVLEPAEYTSLPPESLDLISVVSVVQYMKEEEFREALFQWHAQLRPGGLLVLGDLVPRRVRPLSDVFALLRYCRREGYFLSGVGAILASLLSNYGRIRRAVGLTRYDETDLPGFLNPLGFAWRRYEPNLGINQARMTIVATKMLQPAEP